MKITEHEMIPNRKKRNYPLICYHTVSEVLQIWVQNPTLHLRHVYDSAVKRNHNDCLRLAFR